MSLSVSEMFRDSMIDCTMSGDPSKLSNVLRVTDPNATLTCRPEEEEEEEEFCLDCRPALVG